ncbi:MAG: hypothetical protein ABFS45_25475 [Pseudomonadota bacterium]
MGSASKLNKLLTTSRDKSEAEDWIFSLTPMGVAFVFYVMFIMSTNIEPKGLFLAYGAAAGFIGLESYWIVRGWRKNNASTIVMGLIGIAITMSLLFLYISFI